jgi:hypothetical protein
MERISELLKDHMKRKCSETIVFEMPRLYFLDKYFFWCVFHIVLNTLLCVHTAKIFFGLCLEIQGTLFCTFLVPNKCVVFGLCDRKT